MTERKMTETKRLELTRLKEELVFTILKYKEIYKELPDGKLEMITKKRGETQLVWEYEEKGKNSGNTERAKSESVGKSIGRNRKVKTARKRLDLDKRQDQQLFESMIYKMQLDAADYMCRYNLCAIVEFMDGETDSLELLCMFDDEPETVDVTDGEMMNYFLPMLKTKGGEYVCTISEALIADYLFDEEIAYVYKKKLVMKDGTIRRPTFILFDPYADKEIYFEYFEMMENPDRVDEFCRVQELYMANGFAPGKNYIYDMESQSAPLNMERVDALVKGCMTYDGIC